MRYSFHQLKKRLGLVVRGFRNVSAFLGVVMLAGFGSGWYMMETGSALTTHSIGPWRAWTNAGRVDADPYTRAHFARAGSLPLTTEIASTYTARTDSSGGKLQGRCAYVIEGKDLPATWWSINVFDDRGRLIPNTLERYSYTSDTIALRADGSFTVTVGRDVQPGNWVPTSGNGRLSLVLNLIEPPTSFEGFAQPPDKVLALPSIRRTGCR